MVRTYPLIGHMSFRKSSPSHPHSCLSQKIYSLFVQDGVFGSKTEDISSDEDTSQETARSTRRSMPSPNAPTSTPSSRQPTVLPGQNESPSWAAASAIPVSSGTSVALQQNSSLFLDDVPAAIWTTEWVPIEGRYAGVFFSETLLENVCTAVNSSIIWDDLEVRGLDVGSLIAKFKAMLGDAVDSGDFTSVLSPEQSFVILVTIPFPPSVYHI